MQIATDSIYTVKIAGFSAIYRLLLIANSGNYLHLSIVPAGTRRLCNVRLTLDMKSDRRGILVENENRVDVNI